MKGFVDILLTTMFLSRCIRMSTSMSTRASMKMRMSSSPSKFSIAPTGIRTTTRSASIPTSSSAWSSSSGSRRCISSRQPSRLFTASTTADVVIEDDKPKAPRKFVAKPFEYHELVTLRIDSLTNMGWGVGRVKLEPPPPPASSEEEGESGNDDDQEEKKEEDLRLWVVMVPHVIVGDLVQVRIFRNYKGYSEADLMQVVEASEHRVEPKCALAGRCGGCQYQHMSIDAQRDWKTKHVEEVLLQQHIAGYDNNNNDDKDQAQQKDLGVLPTLGTDEVFGYRSKITPHYEAPKEVLTTIDDTTTVTTYEMGPIGFQQSANRNLVDVLQCPIASPALNEKLQETRDRLHQQAPEGLLNIKKKKKKRGRGSGMGATLLFRHADDDKETGESVVVTDHNQYMTTTTQGLTFRYLAGNFFQNNNYVLPLMVDTVVEAATKPTAAGKVPSHLIDCYCGSGLFALSAASKFNVCVGIELNQKAIEEATINAELNEIKNCQFVAASAEAIFTSPPKLTIEGHSDDNTQVKDFPRDQTVIVLDPPRKGCSTEFLEQLYEYSPQRIVYMSCGPATQARDAKGIVEIGGYDIISIQPFDLFPQTKHIECLMIFEKREAAADAKNE